MPAITGPGTLLDASTGQVLGKVDRITIAISCDTRPLRDAFEAVTLQLRTTAEQMRQFGRAFGDRRLETLRHQARRKGRPGWRAIRIPKAPRFLIAHDDHVDALAYSIGPCRVKFDIPPPQLRDDAPTECDRGSPPGCLLGEELFVRAAMAAGPCPVCNVAGPCSCGGTPQPMIECPDCEGRGWNRALTCCGNGTVHGCCYDPIEVEEDCIECHGLGEILEAERPDSSPEPFAPPDESAHPPQKR